MKFDMKKLENRKSKTKVNYLAIIAALLLGLMIAGVPSELKGLELWLFKLIYNLGDGFRIFFLLITELGGSLFVAALTVSLLAYKKLNLALQVIVSGITSYAVVELIKQIVQRPRPYTLITDVVNRQPSTDGFGFPSGHTTVVMVLALLLWSFIKPNLRWVLVVWVVLVAASRIYLGVHSPLDIVGGLVLGVCLHGSFNYFYRKFHKFARNI